jgi:hypothetical protein
LAGLEKPDIIADTVLAELHKRVRQFVAEAHAIMLDDRELEKVSRKEAKAAANQA